MRKLMLLSFFALLGIYAAGICIGGIRQVKSGDQGEMYEYLSGAVSEYDAPIPNIIKSVAEDNVKILAVLAFGGLFKAGLLLISAVMLLKGYATGFSITAVLRFYGMKGLLLCGANLVSVMLLVPAIAYYGSASAGNLYFKSDIKKNFIKKYIFLLLLLTAIFCIDSGARGLLSAIFMKISSSFTKCA